MRIPTLQSVHLLPLALLCAPLLVSAQAISPKSQSEGKAATQEQKQADANKKPAERGEIVDRLVAIVNGDIILESDIEEEERFSRLYPYRTSRGNTERERALSRLINRDLIIQQMRVAPAEIPAAQIDQEESDLRKDLPACSHADCATEAGWKKFLAGTGFTEEELRDRLKLRLQILGFIEQRFRSGVLVSDKQIQDFYEQTMLPQYQKEHATPPPLSALKERIRELLLEQKVNVLLDEWLKSLRESGRVRILNSGEVAP